MHELILSNVLFIPDFQITLISVNHLAKAGLSTYFPRNSNTCSVYQGKRQILTGYIGEISTMRMSYLYFQRTVLIYW
ncbi:hypothetical protein ID866_11856 [Astraeus odoratus]|nr:hypothetical protein ID866_11856 [Astraeus odoratus]